MIQHGFKIVLLIYHIQCLRLQSVGYEGPVVHCISYSVYLGKQGPCTHKYLNLTDGSDKMLCLLSATCRWWYENLKKHKTQKLQTSLFVLMLQCSWETRMLIWTYFAIFWTPENKLNTQIMNTNIKKFSVLFTVQKKKKNLYIVYTNCMNDTPKIVYNRASTWSYTLHTSCFTVWTTTNGLEDRSTSTLNVNRTLVSCVTLC